MLVCHIRVKRVIYFFTAMCVLNYKYQKESYIGYYQRNGEISWPIIHTT